MREYKITKNEAGQRFDKYLKKLLSQASSSFLYKMLRKKNILLNDKKADGSEKLALCDDVKIYLSEETFLKFSGEHENISKEDALPGVDIAHLPFTILFENQDILVIDKPSGMLSQKSIPEDISANEYILAYLLASNSITKDELMTFRPSICNRLDRNTSGILIAGKTLFGLQDMARKLKSRSMKKYYQCFISGKITDSRHIKGYLRKDPVKNQVEIRKEPFHKEDKLIETKYRPLEIFDNATLLEVHLITGRSHQIRAHLSSIGHPIIGDYKYGDVRINKIYEKECNVHSQLLHASRLQIEDNNIITAPLPETFETVRRYLKE